MKTAMSDPNAGGHDVVGARRWPANRTSGRVEQRPGMKRME